METFWKGVERVSSFFHPPVKYLLIKVLSQKLNHQLILIRPDKGSYLLNERLVGCLASLKAESISCVS